MKEYVLLEKESIETLCSLVRESHGVGNALDDENVATNTTFSSKHILELIESIGAETQYVEVTQAEYDALPSEDIYNDTEYRCTDTGRIYKNGVIYGSDVKEVTIDEYRELEAAGKIEAGVNYMLVRRAENTSLFDASDIGYNDTNTNIGKNDLQGAIEYLVTASKSSSSPAQPTTPSTETTTEYITFKADANWQEYQIGEPTFATKYIVKNGWCYIIMNVECVTTTTLEYGAAFEAIIEETLPRPSVMIHSVHNSMTEDASPCCVIIDTSGHMTICGGTENATYTITLSYPISE